MNVRDDCDLCILWPVYFPWVFPVTVGNCGQGNERSMTMINTLDSEKREASMPIFAIYYHICVFIRFCPLPRFSEELQMHSYRRLGYFFPLGNASCMYVKNVVHKNIFWIHLPTNEILMGIFAKTSAISSKFQNIINIHLFRQVRLCNSYTQFNSGSSIV